MAQAHFYELNESEVQSATLEPGSLICCRDSGNIYMVITSTDAAGSKVKMAETVKYLTNTEREALLAPINGKQYFCYDTGKMYVYYNDWVCLNPDVVSTITLYNKYITAAATTIADSRIKADMTARFIPDLSLIDVYDETKMTLTVAEGSVTATYTGDYSMTGIIEVS